MKIILTFLFCLFFGQGFAQKTLFGKIADKEGNSIFAANVYWKKLPQNGTVSDFEGNFSLKITALPDTLCVSFVGYETQNVWVKNDRDTLRIVLQNSVGLLNEIMVKAINPISEDFSVVKLDKMQVYTNPVAAGDALKAITLLPASSNTDENANPNLRGSPAESTRVLLNGVPIYNPVRNSQLNGLGNFSLFNTETVHKLYLYASNPPLTFGNTSAGLVEIESINELNISSLQVSLGLANTGFFWSKKLPKNNFLQLYSNYQFSEAFIGLNRQNLPRLLDFGTQDVGLNLRIGLGKNAYWNNFTYGISENFAHQSHSYTYEGTSLGSKKRAFTVNNLVKKWQRSSLKINNLVDISYQNYTFGNLASKVWQQQIYTSADYKFFPITNLSLQTGGSYEYANYSAQDSIPHFYFAVSPESPNFFHQTLQEKHQAEIYAFQNWDKNEKFTLSSGIRLNIPFNNQQFYLSHQVSLLYRPLPNHRYLLSMGNYHHYNQANYLNPSFNMVKSRQIALDYNFSGKEWIISAAVYYKKETGAVQISRNENSDNIETKGVELALQKEFGKYFSVNFSQTFLSQRLDFEGKSYPSSANADFFSKMLLNFQHPKVGNLALSYMGRSGKRFTPLIGTIYRPALNFYEPKMSENLNSQFYGNYHNLSLNFSRYFPYQKGSFLFFASVNNLFDFTNERLWIHDRQYENAQAEYYQRRTFYLGMVFQFFRNK